MAAIVRGALGVAVVAIVAAARADGPPGAPLSVTLTDLRSGRGKVGCALYGGPRGFPTEPSAALQQRWCPIASGRSTCRFDAIPPGTYAVACFHDENDNGKLDRGLFGIPSEGTVVTNHAKGSFGPPKFDDAKIAVSGQPTEIALRMSY